MKKLIFLGLFTASTFSLTVSGSEPFCVVDSGGFMAKCYYYTIQSCWAAAYGDSFCIMR